MAPVESAAALLAEARSRAGLSQAELGRRAGVAQSVISAYESGRRQPSLPALLHLLAAAGFTLDGTLRRRREPQLTGPVGRQIARRRDRLRRTLAAHGVGQAWVFGSVARGEDQANSDLDLLVELPATMGLFGLARLRTELEEVAGVSVDLVPTQGLKPALRPSVEAERVPL